MSPLELDIFFVPAVQKPNPGKHQQWESKVRGSIAWFTQASMVIFVEQGCDTVGEAKEKNALMPYFAGINKESFYPEVV
jgi:hypothetical protein